MTTDTEGTAMTRDDAYDAAKTVATRWAADRIYQWQLGRADRDDRDRLAARWGSSIASQVLDAVYDTIHDEGVRAGREQAAHAIRTRADEIQVDPTDYASLNALRRRTLRTAANIAAAPASLAEAAQAFAAAVRDGTLVACNLDDAGRAIEPEGDTPGAFVTTAVMTVPLRRRDQITAPAAQPEQDRPRLMRGRFPKRVGGDTVEVATDDAAEAPSAALERPTGLGAGAEPPQAATEAPRGAETITAHRAEFTGIDNAIAPGAYTARCSCGHTTISIHGLDHVLEILQRHIERMDAAQEANRG